jgi:hypothetical protein
MHQTGIIRNYHVGDMQEICGFCQRSFAGKVLNAGNRIREGLARQAIFCAAHDPYGKAQLRGPFGEFSKGGQGPLFCWTVFSARAEDQDRVLRVKRKTLTEGIDRLGE